MKKIDWYILKKFLSTFFYAIMILTIISVVIDITEKIDDFISAHLSVSYIIVHYYLGFIPFIVAMLFPLFIFIAVIFFTSKMAYRLEIMAVLSSGVSFRRYLRAYWVGGIFLALLLGYANESIVPRANKIKNKFESNYVDSRDTRNNILTNIHMRVDTLTYISMNNFYVNDNYATGFTLEKIHNQKLLTKLVSQSVSWDSTQKVWKTGRAVVRELGDEMKLKIKIISDTALKINLTPKDLLTNTDAMQTMTTKELNQYIASQELRGTGGLNYLYVEKYQRVASAFAVIILTLIGAVIASRKVRGGSGLHLALGLVISVTYILFMRFSTTFSVKGTLNPLLAVWIPNVIFAGVALLLYRKAQK